MKKPAFTFTQEQQYLHMARCRLNGLESANRAGEEVGGELVRIQAAYDEIRGRMSDEDFNAYNAHVNRVLTPAELAAEAKLIAERMSENRERPSH